MRGKELQREFTKIIQMTMLDVDFQGVTGHVVFDQRIHFFRPQINSFQYKDGEHSEVVMIYVHREDELIKLPGKKMHSLSIAALKRYS